MLLVSGPTSDGDGAFDYDGSATISGGTVLMVGSTGMAQSFTGGTQAFAMASASGEAGQSVCMVDGSGNVMASFTATKRFGMVLTSSPAFAEGGEYTLVIGGEVGECQRRRLHGFRRGERAAARPPSRSAARHPRAWAARAAWTLAVRTGAGGIGGAGGPAAGGGK